MPKIVKRTVTTTEEYVDDRDLDGLEAGEEEPEDQEGEEENSEPQSERRRRR